MLNIIEKSIKELKPYENNSKLHPEKQINQIAKSIQEFGFNVPILIDAENVIIAGHGRYFAALKLELENVPCILIDHLSDVQKRAFIIADNKLTMNTGFNTEMMKSELEFLDSIDFETMGFDPVEMENIFSIEVANKTVDEFEEKVNSIKDEQAKYPIVPEFSEDYNCFIILVKNEIDELFVRNAFGLDDLFSNTKGLSNRKSNVIEVEKLREILCQT